MIGESFSFEGETFESFLKVLDYSKRSPPGRIDSAEVLGLDGAFETGTIYQAYDLQVIALITASSYAAALAHRDALMLTLNTRTEGSLVIDEEPGRYYPAKFRDASPIDRLTPEAFRIVLNFRVKSPFQFAVTPTVITLGPTVSNPQTLNTPAAILGSADGFGVWILKVNAGSPGLKTIGLQNVTAGTAFTHQRSLVSGAGNWFRYTPERQRIEYSADAGDNWAKSPEGWTGSLPFLKVGAVNQLIVASADPVTVEITYNAAFL